MEICLDSGAEIGHDVGMKECKPSPEGDARIATMRAANRAFHDEWWRAAEAISRQLKEAAFRIVLAQQRGIPVMGALERLLPSEEETRAHGERLRLECCAAQVCYVCGGEVIDDFVPICKAKEGIDT